MANCASAATDITRMNAATMSVLECEYRCGGRLGQ
jgi:hypothetical protein